MFRRVKVRSAENICDFINEKVGVDLLQPGGVAEVGRGDRELTVAGELGANHERGCVVAKYLMDFP